MVGIQTSADYIYHLQRIGTNRYLHKPKDSDSFEDIEIEDSIMKPLVSGTEAKRYQMPKTTTYILFPYEVHDHENVSLYTAQIMKHRFPKTYLKRYEKQLRMRENMKFDDDQWYRFGRHQNIGKQEIPKLCVAQTVPGMRVCYDEEAKFYLNNVRVNGIIPSSIDEGWYWIRCVE